LQQGKLELALQDTEQDALLTRVIALEAALEAALQEPSEPREAPTSLHHATALVVLALDQPVWRRLGFLFSSFGLVALQLVAALGAIQGLASAGCINNSACSTGQWCAAQSAGQCRPCRNTKTTEASWRNVALGTRYGAPSGLPYCTANFTAATWATCELAAWGWEYNTSEYGTMCAACYTGATGFISKEFTQHRRVQIMQPTDWLALFLCSVGIATTIANEVCNIQSTMLRCRAARTLTATHHLRRGATAGRGWHVALHLIAGLRKWGVCSVAFGVIPLLIMNLGGGALSIFLNFVAMVFLLEIDDAVYAHGLASSTRQWCEAQTEPELAQHAYTLGWFKVACLFSIPPGIILGTSAPLFYVTDSSAFALSVAPLFAALIAVDAITLPADTGGVGRCTAVLRNLAKDVASLLVVVFALVLLFYVGLWRSSLSAFGGGGHGEGSEGSRQGARS
jgi:hypothetical protein